MKEVFVDTSGFYAFLDLDDPHHSSSRGCFLRSQREGWSLVTTHYVLHETWALVQARLGWAAVDAWRDGLVRACDIVWVSQQVHALGEARCRQARERRLSLTDCVSFEIMRCRGIREALAWDEHFAREGFGLPDFC